MLLNIHPSFSKEFIREPRLCKSLCFKHCNAWNTLCCRCEIFTRAKWIRQHVHQASEALPWKRSSLPCFFTTWLTEINPNQTYYKPPSPALFFLGSLKWNKSVRLTRQRASCQSTVPLSERRGCISIARRQTHPRTLVFPWDLNQTQDPPFPCSSLQAWHFPSVCKSRRAPMPFSFLCPLPGCFTMQWC